VHGRIRAAALALLVATMLGLVVVGADPAAVAAKRPPKPPKPVVSKVDPRTGPPTGGTQVTIKGKHLKTATKVLFGKAKGTKLKVKSDKKLTVVAPPHAAGVVDVGTFTDGGVSGAPVRTPFQDGESSLHGISLDSATSAVVVGQYVDEQDRTRGLLVTGVQVGS